MVAGTYSIIMKSPMGPKKGTLTIAVDGDVVSGTIEVLGKNNPFSGGKVAGGRCLFSGTLQTSIGKLSYDVDAVVDDDRIEGVAKSPKGSMKITGTRV